MKKQIDLQLTATLVGGLLFNYLFWMERLALNLLLYSLFIFILLLIDKEMIKSRKMLLAGASHLLAGILVVFNNSDLSVFTWYLSLGVFIGFAHSQLIRSIFTALLAAFLQLITAPFNLFKKILDTHFGKVSIKPVLKPIKYVIIPIFVLILFSILYSIANPVFAKYAENIIQSIADLVEKVFNFFFSDLSFIRLIHVFLGILFTAGLIIAFKNKALEKAELTCEEKLIRKRRTKKDGSFIYELTALFASSLLKRKMALKTENIIGIISFSALNLLLLALNTIDINTLWFGNESTPISINYSAELHEGTNALILSIVMAMIVILYFFSGNINFFSKNKTIRILAYVWIIQNAFLVSSVFLRDYNYIAIYGLTYKRIGVIIFLLLCTIGLTTVYIKVAQKKTLFYLFKANGLVWYVLLLAFGFINWDVFIVSYNINNRDSVALDLEHTLNLSNKTLPLLDQNRAILKSYILDNKNAITKGKGITYKQEQEEKLDQSLNFRIDHFKKTWDETSWLSWNYRDWQTHEYLENNKK